jgi:hypothetical protein
MLLLYVAEYKKDLNSQKAGKLHCPNLGKGALSPFHCYLSSVRVALPLFPWLQLCNPEFAGANVVLCVSSLSQTTKSSPSKDRFWADGGKNLNPNEF